MIRTMHLIMTRIMIRTMHLTTVMSRAITVRTDK